MNVLLSWLRQFAPVEGDPHELADVLTDLGLVVEEVRPTTPDWDGVIVAKVLALSPHPDADKIQLVSVDTGGALTAEGNEAAPAGEGLQICCGAFNMSVGDLVPLATLGTTMPNGMEIARRKMRGEWSNGMLCSGSELELSSDHDGIHILDPGLTIGQPLTEALGREDGWLFDIDVEGNRPDALSVLGVARDLAAKLGVPFDDGHRPIAEDGATPASQLSSVEIGAPEFCPRFGVRVLENVTMGQTPGWMVDRLTACGVRSINPIVDISNYVMLELGQPNHTYDLDLVPGGKLGVRMARAGEELVTLDDQTRVLTEADGVIIDANDQPIGLAGVMGGASTEISDDTRRVVLEAAVWDRMTIARTSRRLGLRSEASTRFERGVDPLGIERALDRFCELAIELCGATIAPGRVVVDGGYKPTPPVRVRVAKVNHLLNTDLDLDAVAALLDPIGFTSEVAEAATAESPGVLTVTVPSWRPDSSIEEDVVEEVGRHHGYAQSGKRVPTPAQNGELTTTQQARRRVRRALLGEGLTEAMPLPFLAPDDLERAGLTGESPIALENPLVAEESILRTSLLPGLLKAVAYNQSHRNAGVQLYEIGRVFHRADEGSDLPNEPEHIAAVLDQADAADATRLLWRIARSLGLESALKIVNGERAGLHPTRSGEVVFRGRTVGEVGEVDPRVAEAYEISGRVGWLRLDLAPLLPALEAAPKYQPVSNYPSSDIDLAFVVPDDVPVSDLTTTLASTGRPLLRRLRFLNAYRSDELGAGVRSLAFGLRLQADDRTLTDAEVAEVRQKLIDAVASKNNGTLRG